MSDARVPGWLFGLLLALATAVAYAPRVAQYREWQDDRAKHFAGRVVTATHDSYLWFREAREMASGEWQRSDRDALRRHPDGTPRSHGSWMSRALAFVAPWSGGDVYEAGLRLALATSCLFVIPLGLYAASAGWPAAGLLAGLLGSASQMVIVRTAIHSVDTDPMNLFGLWWICFAFTWPKAGRTPWKQITASALAGVSVALFVAWYQKPGFVLALTAAFGFCLFARRFAAPRLALLVAVFLIGANPLSVGASARHLIQTAKLYAALSLQESATEPSPEDAGNAPAAAGSHTVPEWSPLDPTSFRVSELQRMSLPESLERILSPGWLAAVGLLAFAGWALRQWRVAAPLAPICALGFLGLVTAKRFLIYLAPLAGFGLGVLLSIAARTALRRTRLARHAESVACGLCFVAFGALLPATSYQQRPKAAISIADLAGLQRCARKLPPGSVVWHSWGYGYLVQDVMGAATYTDGGGTNAVVDHLMVKALTGSDAEALSRTMAYLDRRSQRDVELVFREDYAAAYRRLLEETSELSTPSFVLFTPRSLRDFNAYARRGQWDSASGRPGSLRIQRFRCGDSKPQELECSGPKGWRIRIDLRNGFVEQGSAAGGADRISLARLLWTRGGFVARALRYPHRSGLFAVVAPGADGRSAEAYLMPRSALHSNLVQLYLLGRPDRRFLELVCDEFPAARLYRVRRPPG